MDSVWNETIPIEHQAVVVDVIKQLEDSRLVQRSLVATYIVALEDKVAELRTKLSSRNTQIADLKYKISITHLPKDIKDEVLDAILNEKHAYKKLLRLSEKNGKDFEANDYRQTIERLTFGENIIYKH